MVVVVKIDATLNLGLMEAKYKKAFAIGGPIQQFIDSTVLNGVEPYIPMRIGTTTKSGILHSEIGSGKLTWKTPYVRYIWYGKSKTGRDLVYGQRRHPLAGKMWAERYKADHFEELKGMVIRKVANI